MKNLIFTLITIATLTSCTQKIGFVNTEKLIQDYKGTITARKTLEDKYAKVQKELVKLESDFQEKVKKMSKAKLNRKMNALSQEDAYIQQQKRQVQMQYQNDGQKGLETVSKEVNEFVKKYAKEKGYQFILGTVDINGSVLYGDEKADITYDVLKALNNIYKEPKVAAETTETPKTEEKKTKETKSK